MARDSDTSFSNLFPLTIAGHTSRYIFEKKRFLEILKDFPFNDPKDS